MRLPLSSKGEFGVSSSGPPAGEGGATPSAQPKVATEEKEKEKDKEKEKGKGKSQAPLCFHFPRANAKYPKAKGRLEIDHLAPVLDEPDRRGKRATLWSAFPPFLRSFSVLSVAGYQRHWGSGTEIPRIRITKKVQGFHFWLLL